MTLLLILVLAQPPPEDERMATLVEEETQVALALDALDRQIADTVLSQQRAAQKRAAAAAAAQASLGRLSAQQEKVTVLRGQLKARLRVRHTREPDAYLPVLLSARTVHQMVRHRGLIRWILRKEVGLLGALRDEQQALTNLVEEQDTAAAELAAAERTLAESRADLEHQRGLHARLLETIRNERELLVATLASQEESRLALTRRLGAGDIVAADAGGMSAERGRLPWPARGRLLMRFGDPVAAELGANLVSQGWRIGARFGESVRAVYGGTVAYAGWYRGFGNLMIIEHPGKFYSLYAHLSVLGKAAGDTVVQGEAIGEVGDSGSLRGAQLYFELRHQRRSLDPGAWLERGL